ncbi:MAG: enolase C-terminal domain-like protein [Rhodospirillaceae bacterium]
MSDGAPFPVLSLQSVTTRAVRVPLTFALGTSADVVRAVPLLLVDVLTAQGITGRAYVFCYTAAGAKAIAGLVTEAVELAKTLPATTPLAVMQGLSRRYALLGVTGPVRMALSVLDMALWDALAVSVGLPLATVLGGAPRPIRAYDSRGLGLMEPDRLADEAEALLAKGLHAIKLRLGHPTLAEDLAALRAVRGRISGAIPVMVDYNQALTRIEALRRGRALQDEGIAWLEEPLRHDDTAGNAAVAQALAVPVQIGENFNGPQAMLEAVTAGACDLVMPDVSRIGGVTGWMQAAGIAAAAGIEMSSHLMPEASAHLLSATPTAHWLEYVDWADAILEDPLPLADGAAVTSTRPGLGLTWDEGKLNHLEML